MPAILVVASMSASMASAQILHVADVLNTEIAETNKQTGHDQPRIPVRVYDFAHVDRDVLLSAEKVTTEIFRKAGTEVVWLDRPAPQCSSVDDGGLEFRLNIVPRFEMLSGGENSKDDPLGFAIPCNETDRVCLFYIVYSRISAWAGRDGTDPSRILGHVMAHEIGHALLGPNAHAPTGIMQGRLPRLDMGRVLYFTDIQSQQLRADLAGRIRAVKVGYATGLRFWTRAESFHDPTRLRPGMQTGIHAEMNRQTERTAYQNVHGHEKDHECDGI